MPPTILITGATDGIGKALARQYHESGATLILNGRRSLDELSSSLFTPDTYCQVDLSSRDCAAQMRDWLDAQHIQQIDILIHNAGVGYVGAIPDQPTADIRQLVDVNLRAPVALTHALLPHVQAAPDGVIAFVSSVASALPAPEYAVYAATKAALDSFAANLRIELQNQPRVLVVHPGATRTGMHHKSGMTETDTSSYAPAHHVAAQIRRAIDHHQTAQTIGISNRALRALGQYLPGIADWLVRRTT